MRWWYVAGPDAWTSTTVIEVHQAGPQTWREVRDLRLAALADAPNAFTATLAEEADQPASFWRDRLPNPRAVTLMARVRTDDASPRPAGLTVVAPWFVDRSSAGLYSVWVAPWARGRGVADALLAAAIDHAAATGYPRICLDVADDNAAAIALYARFGFLPTGRTGALPAPRDDVTEHERARALP
jgi:ribosomal protein S18 acetylase RimI-like enzyme